MGVEEGIKGIKSDGENKILIPQTPQFGVFQPKIFSSAVKIRRAVLKRNKKSFSFLTRVICCEIMLRPCCLNMQRILISSPALNIRVRLYLSLPFKGTLLQLSLFGEVLSVLQNCPPGQNCTR